MHERAMIQSFMAALISEAGGVEASAALIGARLGHEVSKGTISKRMHGQLDWPMVEIIALEDAVGNRCVRRWLARSLPENEQSEDLMRGAAAVSKEAGEAVAAVMQMITGQRSPADARREVSEALTAFTQLAARMDADADGVA